MGVKGMKYKREEMQALYDRFLETEQNQFEIFQQLRSACVAFTNLESFTGDAATSAKAYIEDVHLSVIDTFNIALMELEIRLMSLLRDFIGTVDDSAVAVLNKEFIVGKRDDFDGLGRRVDCCNTDAIDAVSRITSYVTLAELPYSDVKIVLNAVRAKLDEVLGYLHDFDVRHQGETENIRQMLSLINQAIAYMGGAIQNDWASYSSGAVFSLNWAKEMADRRMAAFLYSRDTDPNFYETCYVAAVTQCGFDVIEQMLGMQADGKPLPQEVYQWLRNGCVDNIALLTPEVVQTIRAYRAGLILTPVIEEGAIYIQMRTRSGKPLSNAERRVALERLDAPIPKSNSTLRRLFDSEKGLCVWSDGPLYYSELFGKTESWDDMVDLAEDLRKGDFSRAGAMSKMGKILKGAGIAGDVFTLGMDVADGFYDERTQSFSAEVDGYEMAGALIVDGGIIVGGVAGGSALGSLFVPFFGTAAGAVAGLVVGVLAAVLDIPKLGEPPKSFFDNIKDGTSGALEGTGNFFSKVFW